MYWESKGFCISCPAYAPKGLLDSLRLPRLACEEEMESWVQPPAACCDESAWGDGLRKLNQCVGECSTEASDAGLREMLTWAYREGAIPCCVYWQIIDQGMRQLEQGDTFGQQIRELACLLFKGYNVTLYDLQWGKVIFFHWLWHTFGHHCDMQSLWEINTSTDADQWEACRSLFAENIHFEPLHDKDLTWLGNTYPEAHASLPGELMLWEETLAECLENIVNPGTIKMTTRFLAFPCMLSVSYAAMARAEARIEPPRYNLSMKETWTFYVRQMGDCFAGMVRDTPSQATTRIGVKRISQPLWLKKHRLGGGAAKKKKPDRSVVFKKCNVFPDPGSLKVIGVFS